jgi:hypothetical protein
VWVTAQSDPGAIGQKGLRKVQDSYTKADCAFEALGQFAQRGCVAADSYFSNLLFGVELSFRQKVASC